MRVSVFGLGYVGCVTASCVSRAGHEVIGVDIDAEKVAAVNAGTPPVDSCGDDPRVKPDVQRCDGRQRRTASAPG